MKKFLIIIIIVMSFFMLTACSPVPTNLPNEDMKDNQRYLNETKESKGLTTTYENLSIDHYSYKFTCISGDAVGETDGWVDTKVTPNEWKFTFSQGEWTLEVKAYSDETTVVTSISKTVFINKIANPISDIASELMDSLTGNGIVVFKELRLPAIYADKTNFYTEYTLYESDGVVFSSGTVPMKEVKSGDGVATLDSFQVENVPVGEYIIALTILEMNEKTGLYEIKGGNVADGIIIYPNCKSTVTGTFGDTGAYLNATIRTFQTATTFTGKVDSSKLNVGGNNTYDNFTFTCTADSPKNIRWFVDGIEQTEITCTEKVPVYKTHYYWKCPTCGHEYDVTTEPKTNGRNQTSCTQSAGGLAGLFGATCGGKCTSYTKKDVQDGYKDVEVTKDADGTETEFTVRLSQMGHGNSGATTHYVECIYVDVEGHISSSTQEMFVGSKYFPNLGASSIFIMGNGNEIDHWKINLTPDSSLSTNGFSTYSSAEGDITIDADKGIWISEGLWVVNSATAYDSMGMALIETTNPMKTYINKMNPYINIENVVKAETTETGTIKISDLKMNSLDWTCNYATGHIDPLRVDTDITIYKLDEDGNDDLSFSPVSFHIDGCTLLETGKTVSGTEGGKKYSYHNDTYQIIGENTEKSADVPEGTYRVQIEINSGTRDQYITTYGNNYKANYAGYTKGHLEVIVNVQAHTTQTVTGTLSCNHCIKTDGTI